MSNSNTAQDSYDKMCSATGILYLLATSPSIWFELKLGLPSSTIKPASFNSKLSASKPLAEDFF